MDPDQNREKLDAAIKLLRGESTSVEKIESTLTLLRGINPKVDKLLVSCSKSLSTVGKLQKGEIIEFAAENLPDETPEEKKRKKAILFLLKNLKDLNQELERVKKELAKSKGAETQINIAALAKGPFGLITALALLIVLVLAFMRGNQPQTQNQTQTASVSPQTTPSPTPALSPATTLIPKSTIQVITFNGKKIPLSELEVRTGPDCTNSPSQAPHYHAKNGQWVRATDGTVIPDPGACAFGKVEETKVEEIESF